LANYDFVGEVVFVVSGTLLLPLVVGVLLPPTFLLVLSLQPTTPRLREHRNARVHIRPINFFTRKPSFQ